MRLKTLIFLLLSFFWLLLLTTGYARPSAAHLGVAPVAAHALAAPQDGPALAIAAGQVVTAGQSVQVPMAFQSNGNAIAAMIFSIDLDEQCLALDLTDQNQDGRPDAIAWQLPAGLTASVLVDLNDTKGELDFTIADFFPPFTVVPDRAALVTLTLKSTCQPPPGSSVTAAVAFSTSPAPSFGSTSGASVTGSASDGSVIVVSATAAPSTTPTPTATATTQPTPVTTGTATPTPTVTPTPTLIPTIPTVPPVTIVEAFTATIVANGIELTWRTSSEFNSAGFYLYRLADKGELTFRPISALIPAHGPGSYQFTDNTVLLDIGYTYLLVEQKNNGSLLEYDDLLIVVIGSDPEPNLRLWLPLVHKK